MDVAHDIEFRHKLEVVRQVFVKHSQNCVLE